MDTLNTLFQTTVAKYADKVALRYKENKEYRDITYAELAGRVQTFASGLAQMGVQKGDRIALLSENRPEWAVCDLAALSLGAIVVPIYPTLPAPQVAYICRNSGAKLLIVGDAKQKAKADAARPEAPELQTVVLLEGDANGETGTQTYAQIMEQGKTAPLSNEDWQTRQNAVVPDDVASLVYTSGTTGDPKGAMLTHGNFLASVDDALAHYAGSGEPVTSSDTFLSFLPLSHAYERTTGYYLPMRVGATIAYSEGVRTLASEMAQVHPTLMVCVPRVYESVAERITDTAEKEGGAKAAAFHKALEVGKEVVARKRQGKGAGPILGGQHLIFEKAVYGPIREKLGGKFRFFVSGGAPLHADIARFWEAIGIPISEGYGMTEASPVISINPVHQGKPGMVGTVVPQGTLQIAPDGEILYRGPNIMKGYWKNDEATREIIDADGWLHTGDIGEIDGDGYLKITDRKKDILVLANGKNVAPQPIEQALKQSAFLSEVMLMGDKQNIVTALVIPNKAKLAEWAKSENIAFADEDALLTLPETRKKIKAEIDAQSSKLADFERVKKFALIAEPFSVEGGELTPTLKVKRKVVMQKYATEVAGLGGGEE